MSYIERVAIYSMFGAASFFSLAFVKTEPGQLAALGIIVLSAVAVWLELKQFDLN